MFRPGNQDTKLYETLGISKSATDSEIKKAYRKASDEISSLISKNLKVKKNKQKQKNVLKKFPLHTEF